MISLRPLCPEDADSLLFWMNDPDTTRYLGYGFLKKRSREEVQELISLRLDGDLSGECYAIQDENGTYLGQCELLLPDYRAKKAEVALIVLPAYRGKGVGKAALDRITRVAFEELGFRKLTLRCVSSNLPALRLYEKAGFVREGQLKEDLWVDGKPEDVVLMAKFR